MSNIFPHESDRLPVLFIAAGRQRVGKTTVLNAIIDNVLTKGAKVGVPVAEEPEVRFSINGSGAGLLAGDRCMS